MRLRRNCTTTETFHMQALSLKQKCIDKGYDMATLDTEIQHVTQIDRRSLLSPKSHIPNETFKHSMLTSFSSQHRDIKMIIERHWGILRNDHILGNILPERPKVIYKGAPSLQGKIAPYVIDPPPTSHFLSRFSGILSM